MSTPEAAVRSYLQWLEDPESVRDHAAIAEVTAASRSASDPLERLKALSALQALEAVDGDKFEAAFVTHAATWASDNSVTPEAFEQLGVSTDVLVKAGLAKSKLVSSSGKRRTRVSPESVMAAIPVGRFSIADLEAASGASTATVRKVIAEMTEAGTLRDLGPNQAHSGRGRAPLLFIKG